MDIAEQVKTEADRIVARGGFAEGAASLCALYAEVLGEVLTRIMQMEEQMDKNTYVFLMAPVDGRAGE